MNNNKSSSAYSVHIEGKTFTIPVNGRLDGSMKIVDKFGGKARVCSILVAAGNDDIYLTVGKTGGAEKVIDNAALSTLKQNNPIALEFGAGDYDVTLRSRSVLTEEKIIDLSLYVKYEAVK